MISIGEWSQAANTQERNLQLSVLAHTDQSSINTNRQTPEKSFTIALESGPCK